MFNFWNRLRNLKIQEIPTSEKLIRQYKTYINQQAALIRIDNAVENHAVSKGNIYTTREEDWEVYRKDVTSGMYRNDVSNINDNDALSYRANQQYQSHQSRRADPQYYTSRKEKKARRVKNRVERGE